MKILVDIPEPQLRSLNDLAKERASSRSQIVRDAIHAYLLANRKPLSSYFGLWTRSELAKQPAEDGLAYQDRIRSEW